MYTGPGDSFEGSTDDLRAFFSPMIHDDGVGFPTSCGVYEPGPGTLYSVPVPPSLITGERRGLLPGLTGRKLSPYLDAYGDRLVGMTLECRVAAKLRCCATHASTLDERQL